MKHVIYQLDGMKSGFAFYLYEKEAYFENKEGDKLFPSLELGKTALAQEENIYNPYDYEVHIILDHDKDDHMIDIDFAHVELYNEYYEYYDGCGYKYYIKPKVQEILVDCGYLIFDNGDQKGQNGKKRSKEYYHWYIDIITNIITHNYETVEKIYRDRNGHITMKLKDCTGLIHLCYNSDIMSLNQNRKAMKLRVLPFDKSLDKFKSLYLYTTIDSSEPEEYGTRDLLRKVKKWILSDFEIEHFDASPRYRLVDFKGTIKLEDRLW